MDLQLDLNTHDLSLVSGDLGLVDTSDAIRQDLKQLYLFFLGEWFLDNTKGVPYYQFILVKNPNLDLVESTLRTVATSCPGILQLNSFSFSYDNPSRAISPSLQADTTDGPINFQATVEV